MSGEGEGGGPQAGLRLRLSIPGATVSCTPRRCCVSVLQRARHSCVSRPHAHTHTHTHVHAASTYVDLYVAVHARLGHAHVHTRVERLRAYVHEARARVPRSTHLFLCSVRDTRRYLATEATATVRRHARVYRNHPAFRRVLLRGASCRAAISSPFGGKGERGREREKFRVDESSSITGFYHWNRE